MSNLITLRANVAIAGGPTATINRALDVEAYDVVRVSVTAGASDREVDVVPGEGSTLRLLVITASEYAPELTYRIGDSETAHRLDQPLLLLGRSIADLIGTDVDPLSITFANTTSQDVLLTIITGREATVEPAEEPE